MTADQRATAQDRQLHRGPCGEWHYRDRCGAARECPAASRRSA